MSGADNLLVVMYHHVLGPDTPHLHGLRGVSVEEFDRQLQLLSRERNIIACEEFLAGGDLPERPTLLTFDDATIDHYRTAFPVLARRRLTASFFVITNSAETGQLTSTHARHLLAARMGDQPMMQALRTELDQLLPGGIDPLLAAVSPETAAAAYRWDEPEMARFKYALNFVVDRDQRELAVRSLFEKEAGDWEAAGRRHFAGWDDLEEMQAAGMHIGGHSHTHEALAMLSDQTLEEEIALCAGALTRRLGDRQRAFSYPYGKAEHFDDRVIAAVRRYGFRAAFTNLQGDDAAARVVNERARYEIARFDPKDLAGSSVSLAA